MRWFYLVVELASGVPLPGAEENEYVDDTPRPGHHDVTRRPGGELPRGLARLPPQRARLLLPRPPAARRGVRGGGPRRAERRRRDRRGAGRGARAAALG